MSFLSSLNISGSGLTAEHTRLGIVAENISNMDTTRTADGGPYTRKLTVFQATESRSFGYLLSKRIKNSIVGTPLYGAKNDGAGVIVADIVDDETDYKRVYEPEHPDADEDGYVLYPNVDVLKETADAMSATRAYQANVTALNSIKQMATTALDIRL